jgi:hypothetical protein
VAAMVSLIIFGTRKVVSSKQQGMFWCPRCASSQPFDHKRTRRFFTLYFIPLIPLDTVAEYVECQACRYTFEPSVLQYAGGGPPVA